MPEMTPEDRKLMKHVAIVTGLGLGYVFIGYVAAKAGARDAVRHVPMLKIPQGMHGVGFILDSFR